jgi:peptidoglycan-N-acetylglucosamine deacetylase
VGRASGVFCGTVLAALTLAASALAARDPSDVHGPLDLRHADLVQGVHGITLSATVVGPLKGRRLAPRPDNPGSASGSLCLELAQRGSPRSKRLCLGRPDGGPWTLGVENLGSSGRVLGHRAITPRVRNADRTSVAVRFAPALAGLGIGRYRWHAKSVWNGGACPSTCTDRAPDHGQEPFRVYGLRLAGCRFGGITPVNSGPANRRRIALTFDDGPSDYTHSVITELAAHNSVGTFFEVGQEIAGRQALMREAIANGDEIGDHTMHHTIGASEGDIAEVARLIKAATGFRPCLFRPPYGAYDSTEVARARAQRMSLVTWDIDPTDWATPGTDAIYERVVSHAHPGAIVLMHDGGGNRSETVAALPRIIATLHRRGYKLVTVSRLLGQKMIYRLDR